MRVLYTLMSIACMLQHLRGSALRYSGFSRYRTQQLPWHGGAPLGAVEADCELSIGAVGGRRILCRRS